MPEVRKEQQLTEDLLLWVSYCETPVNDVAKGRGTVACFLICLAVLNIKLGFLLFSGLEGQRHAFVRQKNRTEGNLESSHKHEYT